MPRTRVHTRSKLTGILVARTLGLLVIISVLGSCASPGARPSGGEIPQGMAPTQLIQKGQERLAASDWAGARDWFTAVSERFPEQLGVCAEAEYNLCLVLHRQKKWSQSKLALENWLTKWQPQSSKIPSYLVELVNRLKTEATEKLPKQKQGATGAK